LRLFVVCCSFLYSPATSLLYSLSLHDALPISFTFSPCISSYFSANSLDKSGVSGEYNVIESPESPPPESSAAHDDRMMALTKNTDRKSTRLNSSHVSISYAVFCLKKKKRTTSK